MEFLDARVRVPGIIGSRIKPNQHAHAIVFRVHREYFDVDAWRRLLPLWFERRFERRHKRPRSRFTGDSPREPVPQRFRGAQYIGGPADKRPDNGPERLDLLAAILA